MVQELADFKAESKELRNQDLTIKRLEAQLSHMKAQLQNKVCSSRCMPKSLILLYKSLVMWWWSKRMMEPRSLWSTAGSKG